MGAVEVDPAETGARDTKAECKTQTFPREGKEWMGEGRVLAPELSRQTISHAKIEDQAEECLVELIGTVSFKLNSVAATSSSAPVPPFPWELQHECSNQPSRARPPSSRQWRDAFFSRGRPDSVSWALSFAPLSFNVANSQNTNVPSCIQLPNYFLPPTFLLSGLEPFHWPLV